MTKSEEILARKARYDRVERVVDELGRTVGVKRLKPSQQVRIQELAPGLEGTTKVTDDASGKTFDVPRASPLIMAAAVVEIDGSPVPFPKTRAELDAVLDMLDQEGLQAIATALTTLGTPEAGTEGQEGDLAKN